MYEYTNNASQSQEGGLKGMRTFLKIAQIASVAIPGGPAAINMLQEAYNFKNQWNSTVGKMSDLEAVIYNTLQPNGLYTRVLITSKLSTIANVPSNVYNTGIFFSCLETMIELVADWNAHNNALKESDNWEDIKQLIGEFENTPPGEIKKSEMEHIENEIIATETDEAMLVNLVTKYENCAILRDLYLKTCHHGFISKPCGKQGDKVLSDKSIIEVLSNQIKGDAVLRGKYISGVQIDYSRYANNRIVDDFKRGIEATETVEYTCYQIGAHFPLNSKVLTNQHLYNNIIHPRMEQLGEKIKQVVEDLKKGKKTKVTPSKLTNTVKGFGKKMREKANRFTKSMDDMTPRSMKGAMGKGYLAHILKIYTIRYDSLLQRWGFITGCLHLEVTYDMWEDNVRNVGSAQYQKWLDYSNKIVVSLHKCMTDPNIDFEKATSRAKRLGLGCVLMSEVYKHLKSMNYSKGFEDILTGHMFNLSSVSGELKSKATAEGATHFDARRLSNKEDDELINEIAAQPKAKAKEAPQPKAKAKEAPQPKAEPTEATVTTEATDEVSSSETTGGGDFNISESFQNSNIYTSETSCSIDTRSLNTYFFTDN
jgi:hypothetical protein